MNTRSSVTLHLGSVTMHLQQVSYVTVRWTKCSLEHDNFHREDTRAQAVDATDPGAYQKGINEGKAKVAYAQSQPSPLQEMPAEVLHEIGRYLVPTQRLFYIHPVRDKRERDQTVTAIDQFMPAAPAPNDSGACENAIALASTCRVLSDVFYALFYGENDFVFFIRSIPGSSGGWVRCRAEDQIECSSKTFQVQPSRDILWPLSKSALARHVRRLGLLCLRHRHKRCAAIIISRIRSIGPWRSCRVQTSSRGWYSRSRIRQVETGIWHQCVPSIAGRM